jgi:hypothetical protein
MHKKSLKIPKGQSESIYKTDNTMAKRKKVQKDKQRSTKQTHNPTKSRWWTQVLRKNRQFLVH